MLRPRPSDTAFACLLAVAAQAEVWIAGWWRGPEAVDAVVAAAAPMLLVFARRAPVPVLLAAIGLYTANAIAFGQPASITQAIALFTAIIALAACGGERRWAALPAVLAGLAVANLTDPDPVAPGAWVFPLFFYGLAWLIGSAFRRREREQAVLAEAAVMDERVRIARELHDVVAHGISVMVVQAVGGRAALAAPDHPSSGAFDAIEATGKQSLAEMRRLLGVLRTVDEASTLAPQPGLRELDALVDRARDGGLDVRLAVDGPRRALPAGVDLSAYRVLQEALTNAIKHAGPARVDVRVAYEPGGVAISIADDGPGAGDGHGHGHGLTGMRERVELYGGEMRAGPRDGGGFEVRVRLPVEAG